MSTGDQELKTLKREVCDAVDARADQLKSVSKSLHANPELAFAEFRSSELLASTAEQAGLQVARGAYGLKTAFCAEVGILSGPTVAIISEYDALPGVGHACGHNIIAAIGLGSALALHALGEKLPGRVRYLGTPAEERGCGKELMARQGAFNGVDAAMMVHPYHVNAKAFRSICLAEAQVEYRGQAAHPAMGPESARNALDAVVLSYQAVANLRQHLKRGENVSGVITQGGHVPNVFPVQTRAHYFARAANSEDLAVLRKRVEACFRAAGQATGCTASVDWCDAEYMAMKINLPLADAYEANARGLGQEFTDYLTLPIGGADMGNVSQRVPALHALIGCIPPTAALHTPEFAKWAGSARGHKAVIAGAKALAMTALDVLVDGDLRSRVAAGQDA